MSLLSDLVKNYTNLNESGASSFVGKCPFCNGKSVTLGVNNSKNMFNCFSCGINGFNDDFLEFVKEKNIEPIAIN